MNYEREGFELLASSLTNSELRDGRYHGQARSIAELRKFRFVQITSEVVAIADRLVETGVVPPGELADALHLGCAIRFEIDWLLTWNHAHLVNEVALKKLASVCGALKLRKPHVVTPETIPWSNMGQEIRRKDR